MKNSLVWGTCWFNESVEDLIVFYKKSLKSLRKCFTSVTPAIFVANHNFSNIDLEKLKSNIYDLKLFFNKTPIYPNKNYGIAKLVAFAKRVNFEFTAIVDCDWDVSQINTFIDGLNNSILQDEFDIIIPNIGSAAGRSNVLVGQTATYILYPEYFDNIKTVFPGSLIAKTDKLFKIVTDSDYHFDWGGEWDIFSLSVKYGYTVKSIDFDTINKRHRPNSSKVFDGFQIWRAVFSNENVKKRLNKIHKPEIILINKNQLSTHLLKQTYDVDKLIEITEKYAKTDTERQLLYLILYPLAFLINGRTDFIIRESLNKKQPYQKDELEVVAKLAKWCVYSSLINCDKNALLNNAKTLSCSFLSNWNINTQRLLIKESFDNEIFSGNNMFQ